MFDNIANGERDFSNTKKLNCRENYIKDVQSHLHRVFNGNSIGTTCNLFNMSINERNEIGSTLSAFDAVRCYHQMEGRDASVEPLPLYGRDYTHEDITDQAYMIDKAIIGGFYDYSMPILESIVMTVAKIENDIGVASGKLKKRTVDLIYRTFSVAELAEIGLSGEPRLLSHGRLSLFQSCEDHLSGLKQVPFQYPKPKAV